MECGYSLAGLAEGAVCPECGAAAPSSYDGRLIHSARAHLLTLRRGVRLIIWGTLVAIVTVIGAVFATIALMNPSGSTSSLQVSIDFVFQAASVLASVAVAYGWWLFSTPDTALTGRFDGGRVRRLVRVCVVIDVVSNGGQLLPAHIFYGLPGWAMPAVSGVWLIVMAVSFIAQMAYIAWMAPRMQSTQILQFSKLLMWLGPVLFVVGCLCLGLGPLTALVLYIVLMFQVQRCLSGIFDEKIEPAQAPI